MFTLKPIIKNECGITDFGPYVPGLNDAGRVSVAATLAEGGTVLRIDSDSLAHPGMSAISHPDLNSDEDLCAYAEDSEGTTHLLIFRDGQPRILSSAEEGFREIGPLGPSINDRGDVAFRATLADGRAGIFLSTVAEQSAVAITGDEFQAFHGVPIVNNSGDVVVVAEKADNSLSIELSRGGFVKSIAQSGGEFRTLGRFPTLCDNGTVGFVAETDAGYWQILLGPPEAATPVGVDLSAFSFVRGALFNNEGLVCFFGTKHGEELGIYDGSGNQCILQIGEPLSIDSTAIVADFALNPVSVNNHGQFAVRVKCSDDRQYILRADPE